MKKTLAVVLSVLIFAFGFVTVYASDDAHERLVDGASLLSETEAEQLLAELDEISERCQLDIVVLTVDGLGESTPQDYADDFFDYNGYGIGNDHDGILFLFSTEYGDYHISTSGYGITVATDAGIEHIGDEVVPLLREGNYFGAFKTFAEICDEFTQMAREGDPYDTDNLPKEPFDFGTSLLICLVVGLVIAFISVSVMKGKLKSVAPSQSASDYTKPGSFNITENSDLLLYTTLNRVKKPENNNSSGGSSIHTSSSGSTHGGGGGRI